MIYKTFRAAKFKIKKMNCYRRNAIKIIKFRQSMRKSTFRKKKTLAKPLQTTKGLKEDGVMEYEDSLEMAKVNSKVSQPVSIFNYNNKESDMIVDLDDFLLDTDPRQREHEVKNL